MNKKIISGIIISAVIFSNAAAFAAENKPMAAEPVSADEEILLGVQTITVNSETVDFSNANLSQYIFEENGNVMVPGSCGCRKNGL